MYTYILIYMYHLEFSFYLFLDILDNRNLRLISIVQRQALFILNLLLSHLKLAGPIIPASSYPKRHDNGNFNCVPLSPPLHTCMQAFSFCPQGKPSSHLTISFSFFWSSSSSIYSLLES